jgi:GTP-binding protein HflX
MTFIDDFFGPQKNNATLIVAPYARNGDMSYRFDEFVSLCEAAELTPVGVDQAVVREIHPGTYFRSGAIERLRDQVKTLGAGVVAVDADLTPVQQRQLQKLTGASVLERSAIILTIFGRRATSRAGKLQVELAQSQYLLPRLVGLWQHFDRERGGFGVRGGAGEKQIEIDRRLVQQRITKLRR